MLQSDCALSPLKGILIGALAGTILHSPILVSTALAETTPVLVSQAQQRQAITLGVIRSAENAPQWQNISDRLSALDTPYEVIELNDVQQAGDLANFTVVFLPNIQTLSSEQVLALEAWMGQGGRLIVSGPVGSQSSHGVRQALQALLGAYWAAPLSRPSNLQLIRPETQSWLRQGRTSPIPGGVLVPTGMSSQTVVTWENVATHDLANQPEWFDITADGVAAVVITPRTTFLGWEWGQTTQDLDQAWLRATLDRYATSRPRSSISRQPSTRLSGNTVPPAQELLDQYAPFLPNASSPERTTPSSAPAARSTPATPTRSAAGGATQDPADAVAPAGLDVELSAQPIAAMEAIAMRQELESLIGRYESAMLSARTLSASGDVAETSLDPTNPALTASAKEALLSDATAAESAALAAGLTNQPLIEARRILETFPRLVSERDYRAARREWLRARQLLWENFPTDRPIAQPEIRAMWLDRGTIVRAGSRQGLARIFDRLAAAGINTVFFETVNAGYPIYPSRVAPQQNPLTRSWDPLEAAVDLAHERGIELHAWVWVFAAGNRPHNALVGRSDDYLGPILEAHPDWANYDNRGSVIPPGQGKPFLDPANPAVRRYLLSLFEEITTRYNVDGLQLDYIRYPFQDPGAGRTYGYGTASRQQFQRITGVDPMTISPRDRQLWQQWTEFRMEQVNSFVAETSRLLHSRRPELVVSAAVFAMSEHERVQKIQQNWEVWARQGNVDLIVTMSYAMDTNRLHRLAGPWLSENANLGSTLVLPGIRLLNLSDSAAIDQIQALRDLPSGGYSLFAVENLNDNLQAVFSRTQGQDNNSREPIPHRDPFGTAAARYNAMQREWDFMLENNMLWMRQEQLDQWNRNATSLEEALQQLAEDPSPQRLERAKTQLSAFRTRFRTWMYLQSLNHSYRIRTWENRLATLDNLLAYGERVVLQRQNGRAVQRPRGDR